MGIPHKERKEMERRGRGWKFVCVEGGFRMETDSKPKTRREGMNINNALCRKIVTMDIIEQ